MSIYPRTMPTLPRMFHADVLRTRRLSPSFHRVTLAGPELAMFDYAGLDHWFRLFLPTGPGEPLTLPEVTGRDWWQSYLAIAQRDRPHCSNYTVADLRPSAGGAELDIDVVLHWDDEGILAGTVARWAASVARGSGVALLDQGVLFDPPEDATELVLAGDETAMPGIRGIVRALGPQARGRVLLEVPSAGDVEDWPVPEGVQLAWLPREGPTQPAGERVLEALRAGPVPDPRAYAVVVGESELATGGRRWLVGAGLAKERILFSGFFKRERTRSQALGSRERARSGV